MAGEVIHPTRTDDLCAACPFCRAQIGQPCRTRAGHVVSNHYRRGVLVNVARTVKRKKEGNDGH